MFPIMPGTLVIDAKKEAGSIRMPITADKGHPLIRDTVLHPDETTPLTSR